MLINRLTSLEDNELNLFSREKLLSLEEETLKSCLDVAIADLDERTSLDKDMCILKSSRVFYDFKNEINSFLDLDICIASKSSLEPNYICDVWLKYSSKPIVLIDVFSQNNKDVDQQFRTEVYKKLGIEELFYYDFWGDYINPVLQGFRLIEGDYRQIDSFTNPKQELWLFSNLLNLELRLFDGELRFL